MAAIDVENARIFVKGMTISGLDAALTVLKKGLVEVSPEAFGVNPGRKIFVRDRRMEDLRRHESFLSKSERRRLKKSASAKRARRQAARSQQWSSKFMDPKEWHALKEYDTIKDHQRRIAEDAPANNERSDSIATVLVIIEKRGKFLTLEDKEKGGLIGFVTGGINFGESLNSAAERETEEESGLKISVTNPEAPFWEKNVSHSPIPYFMRGLYANNPKGRLKAGIEIVAGSLKWRTAEEVDDLVISGEFIPNHSDFWNKFWEIRPLKREQEVESV